MANHSILTKDTIISFDIETTGLASGIHSMIALGAVAYRNGKEIGSFYAALKEWNGSERSKSTMEFWQKHKAEWDRIQKEARPPAEVMKEFVAWVDGLPGPKVLAANPVTFDASFLFWYLTAYIDDDIVGKLFHRTRALDIRTYIAAMFGVPYSEAERSVVPIEWYESLPYTHNALDDARQQGTMLMNMLKANAGESEMSA